MKSIGFICVHNSCRSQMAEALCHRYYADVFEAYSAGTDVHHGINPQAEEYMQQAFGIDMKAKQYSKTLDCLPKVDYIISMGCGVSCPSLPCEKKDGLGSG